MTNQQVLTGDERIVSVHLSRQLAVSQTLTIAVGPDAVSPRPQRTRCLSLNLRTKSLSAAAGSPFWKVHLIKEHLAKEQSRGLLVPVRSRGADGAPTLTQRPVTLAGAEYITLAAADTQKPEERSNLQCLHLLQGKKGTSRFTHA